MSAYTPRSEIRDGDVVKLIGSSWDILGVRNQTRTVTDDSWGSKVQVSGEDYYVMDPLFIRGIDSDWSVLVVEAANRDE